MLVTTLADPSRSASALFLRHAESEANAGLATSDPSSIPLTARGEAEAHARALEFAGFIPSHIAVSPFLRARQSAQPFIARFPDVHVEEWAIQEFTYISPSKCVGTNQEQRRPMVEHYWNNASADDLDGEGAESFADFLARVNACAQRLSQTPGNTLLFSHEMFMKALLWVAFQKHDVLSPAAFRDFAHTFSIPNLGQLGYQRESAGHWTIYSDKDARIDSDQPPDWAAYAIRSRRR